MRRGLRWVGYGVGGIVALAAIAYGTIYVMSEQLLSRRYDLPAIAISIPTDSASRVEGERLAWLRGCHGCHGEKLQGSLFFDEPRVARIVAPNLTRILPAYSDAELARVLIHGVKPDGRSVVAMPSMMFYHLSDRDLGAIIAHLRSAPAVDHDPGQREVRILGRLGLVTKQFIPEAATIDHSAPRLGNLHDTSHVAHGEYLARTICSECHGPALRGETRTPALAQALGYSREEFGKLLRTGVPRDGRDLELMDDVARSRFVHFRDDEIDDVYAFLRAMPLTAVAADSGTTH
jgi:mono/diheme cytochrome c family protein